MFLLPIAHVPRIEEVIKCETCSECCIGFDLYKLHVEQNHPGTKVRRKGTEICPHCSKDLCSKQKLERHIKGKYSGMPIKRACSQQKIWLIFQPARSYWALITCK